MLVGGWVGGGGRVACGAERRRWQRRRERENERTNERLFGFVSRLGENPLRLWKLATLGGSRVAQSASKMSATATGDCSRLPAGTRLLVRWSLRYATLTNLPPAPAPSFPLSLHRSHPRFCNIICYRREATVFWSLKNKKRQKYVKNSSITIANLSIWVRVRASSITKYDRIGRPRRLAEYGRDGTATSGARGGRRRDGTGRDETRRSGQQREMVGLPVGEFVVTGYDYWLRLTSVRALSSSSPSPMFQ